MQIISKYMSQSIKFIALSIVYAVRYKTACPYLQPSPTSSPTSSPTFTGRTGMVVITLLCALYNKTYTKGGEVEQYVNSNTLANRQTDARGWFEMPETAEQRIRVGETVPYVRHLKR